MNSINDKRDDKRYSISDYLKEEYENVFIEFKLDKPIKAYVTDVSMNGVGFEIKSPNSEDHKNIENAEKFFININLMGKMLLVEAKKTWSSLLLTNDEPVYKGGLMFVVISSDDKLTLLKFLENLRNRK